MTTIIDLPPVTNFTITVGCDYEHVTGSGTDNLFSFLDGVHVLGDCHFIPDVGETPNE